MISQGYSGGSGGPDRSFEARGFGGSCKSDWLGGSEEPSGSCEFYGLVWMVGQVGLVGIVGLVGLVGRVGPVGLVGL